MAETIISVGEQDLTFDVSMDDYNKFINDTLPHDKVAPAFNLLSRTVIESDKEAFKKLVLVEGKPNGMLVMSIAGAVIGEMGGDVEIIVKKPKNSPSK